MISSFNHLFIHLREVFSPFAIKYQFKMEGVNSFPAEEFSAIKSCLSNFLFEMAVKIQARLWDNVAIILGH